jgi:hypothetical protein
VQRAASPGADPEEAPAGTWSEDTTPPPPTAHAAASAPAKGARVTRLDDHRTDPDLTPTPGVALAYSAPVDKPPRSADSTGTRPTVTRRRAERAEVVTLLPHRRREGPLGEQASGSRAATQRAIEDAPTLADESRPALRPEPLRPEPLAPEPLAALAANLAAAPTAVADASAPDGSRPDGSRPDGSRPDGSPPRPPVLASKLLAEDLMPTEPYRLASRIAYGIIGALAIPLIVFGGFSIPLITAAVLLLAIAGFGLARMPYGIRGGAVLSVAVLGIALVGALTQGVGEIAAPFPFVLGAAIAALAGGLLFRQSYRSAWSGRVLTFTGMVGAAIWVVYAATESPLTTVSMEWSSWLPSVVKVGFVFVLLLSLLAFMESSTTAGCAVWAGFALGWYALGASVKAAMNIWGPESNVAPDQIALALANVGFVAAAAFALAQVQVTLAGGTAERRAARAAR